MEESLRNNELKFIGYQSDIRNVLEMNAGEAEDNGNEHPYYSQNKKCKEVYDPFQYKDPYFRYKYNDPEYEVAEKAGNDKIKGEPNGYYTTVASGFPQNNPNMYY